MEKSVDQGGNRDFATLLQNAFDLKEVPIESYSPLALAFIGDSVYDLIIKSIVLNEGNRQVQKLHQATSELVQASTQSLIMRTLQEQLSPDELQIYRRGRNAKSVSPAKNQSLTDYRRATGFEALLGYLYIEKKWERMIELVRLGLEATNKLENHSTTT